MKHLLVNNLGIDNINIDSSFELTSNKLSITFNIIGKLDKYIFPKKLKLKRADELWKATCFELFLANDDEVYYELNFSPSLEWNFYVLDTYRTEPKELEFKEEPHIGFSHKNNEFNIVFELEANAINFKNFKYYNLATILLSKERRRTFWSVKHLNTQPDFHAKNSFLEIT
jgi:hypothetical protein